MKLNVNKIVVLEGLDKTGKSTFSNILKKAYLEKNSNEKLISHSFPNTNSPIGNIIRNELGKQNPNNNIVSTPNFLTEMVHFWMHEIYTNVKKNNTHRLNYIFDRYFVSTLVYQAFYNNSDIDLEFITHMILSNPIIKIPTDIIILDAPNEIILQRTLKDKEDNLVDTNDTTDLCILNKRRECYRKTVDILVNMGITIHWIENVHTHDLNQLGCELIEKIFKVT